MKNNGPIYVYLLVLVASFLLDNRGTREYSFILYFIIVTTFICNNFRRKRLFLFFTPTSLIIIYICLSFGIGSFAFNNSIVLHQNSLYDYNNWEFIAWSNRYYITCLILLILVDIKFTRYYIRAQDLIDKVNLNNKSFKIDLALSFFIFISFSFISLDASIFGGSGDISVIPKTISALVVIYHVALKKTKFRFLIYLFIIFTFSYLSVHDKREAIFLFFPIALLESFLNYKEIKVKHISFLTISAAFGTFLILAMSIARGYGETSTEISTLFQSIPYILNYIKSELFLESFFLNIEVNYTYYHSFKALEYVFENPSSTLSFGSTIVKVLFIFIPRSLLPGKPDSIIHLYTNEISPGFRSVGGSYPINVFGEFFWNFHFFGILLTVMMGFILYILFRKLLLKIKKNTLNTNIWVLYAYMQILTYVRGSGLDLYIVYVIFGILFSKLYIISKLILKTK